jgi:hypothetical protein
MKIFCIGEGFSFSKDIFSNFLNQRIHVLPDSANAVLSIEKNTSCKIGHERRDYALSRISPGILEIKGDPCDFFENISAHEGVSIYVTSASRKELTNFRKKKGLHVGMQFLLDGILKNDNPFAVKFELKEEPAYISALQNLESGVKVGV